MIVNIIMLSASALGDWRGELLSSVRGMIHEAVSEIVEEAQWNRPSNPLGVSGVRVTCAFSRS